jgi:hypothetical protein
LRKHGFSVRNTPESCGGSETVVMVISNGNNGLDPESSDDEGHVICHVDRTTTGKALDTPGVWETDGTARDDAHLILKNVTCSLYSVRDREDETRRLRAAMESLRSGLSG